MDGAFTYKGLKLLGGLPLDYSMRHAVKSLSTTTSVRRIEKWSCMYICVCTDMNSNVNILIQKINNNKNTYIYVYIPSLCYTQLINRVSMQYLMLCLIIVKSRKFL